MVSADGTDGVTPSASLPAIFLLPDFLVVFLVAMMILPPLRQLCSERRKRSPGELLFLTREQPQVCRKPARSPVIKSALIL
jgi:hypothetical protein